MLSFIHDQYYHSSCNSMSATSHTLMHTHTHTKKREQLEGGHLTCHPDEVITLAPSQACHDDGADRKRTREKKDDEIKLNVTGEREREREREKKERTRGS